MNIRLLDLLNDGTKVYLQPYLMYDMMPWSTLALSIPCGYTTSSFH